MEDTIKNGISKRLKKLVEIIENKYMFTDRILTYISSTLVSSNFVLLSSHKSSYTSTPMDKKAKTHVLELRRPYCLFLRYEYQCQKWKN